jgi:hypothetical protein
VNIAEQEIEFNALTCIDPVTNLVELCQMITRMQTTLECTLRMNGWHNTPDHCIVYMIMVANLLDKDSNEFWNVITSRMYLQQ